MPERGKFTDPTLPFAQESTTALDIRSQIKKRELPGSVVIVSESIKTVAEKWDDGLVHETDNLQLVLRNVGDVPLENIFVYLRYLDSSGKEIGHEFDLVNDHPLKPGAEGRVSLMLVPPTSFTSCVLKVEADKVDGSKSRRKELLVASAIVLGVLLFEYFRRA